MVKQLVKGNENNTKSGGYICEFNLHFVYRRGGAYGPRGQSYPLCVELVDISKYRKIRKDSASTLDDFGWSRKCTKVCIIYDTVNPIQEQFLKQPSI